MQLIGMLDSPHVRRVAISLKLLGIPFEHHPISLFSDFDTFAEVNPLVKAPTLITDEGVILVDSNLILDYIEEVTGPEASLMPKDTASRLHARHLIGTAQVACEKTAQILYERFLRPEEKQHQPWVDRVTKQLKAAYDSLEKSVERRSPWLVDETMLQPDIAVCVAWRFTQFMMSETVLADQYPALAAFSAEAETKPEFVATPLD